MHAGIWPQLAVSGAAARFSSFKESVAFEPGGGVGARHDEGLWAGTAKRTVGGERPLPVLAGFGSGAVREDGPGDRHLRRVVESAIKAEELTAAADAWPLPMTAHGGRRRLLSRPGFLSLTQRRQLEPEVVRLHELLTGLPDRLFTARPDEFCRAIGMTPAQSESLHRTMPPPGATDPELAHRRPETVTGAEQVWAHDRLVDLAS